MRAASHAHSTSWGLVGRREVRTAAHINDMTSFELFYVPLWAHPHLMRCAQRGLHLQGLALLEAQYVQLALCMHRPLGMHPPAYYCACTGQPTVAPASLLPLCMHRPLCMHPPATKLCAHAPARPPRPWPSAAGSAARAGWPAAAP